MIRFSQALDIVRNSGKAVVKTDAGKNYAMMDEAFVYGGNVYAFNGRVMADEGTLLAEGVAPVADMPCTIGIGSDCYAAKVVRASKAKLVVVETDEFSGGREWTFRLTKHGGALGSFRCSLGFAASRRDPHF